MQFFNVIMQLYFLSIYLAFVNWLQIDDFDSEPRLLVSTVAAWEGLGFCWGKNFNYMLTYLQYVIDIITGK